MSDEFVDRSPESLASSSIFLPDEPLPTNYASAWDAGPGVGESLAWSVGVIVVHLAAGAVAFLGLLVLWVIAHGVGSLLDSEALLIIAGGDQLIFALCALAAVAWRLNPHVREKLQLRRAPVGHYLLIVLATLPLSLLCSALYNMLHLGWVGLAENYPWMTPWTESIDKLLSMEYMGQLAAAASLPVLVMIIAAAPALSEELIFRGVIGRGLIARWGVWPGVLVTSVLFGMVHLHPAHALAVIPLGIALHVVYLSTRSFYAPVLLHFCNNAWACVAVKYGKQLPVTETQMQHPLLLTAAAALTVAIFWILWQTRVRQNPSLVSAQPAPIESERHHLALTPSAYAALAATGGVFIAVLVYLGVPQ
ncbi:MAG TPA: CPBP family intramembrane glutamic endopeptidase [Planctomycetaceae bacterium]|nr:CPBP family intramembrane glutamic endopeptidase [Planctomycetaceae bacterium]